MRVIDAYQQAGEDMNPIQDIITEVQAHLGIAHGALPDINPISGADIPTELAETFFETAGGPLATLDPDIGQVMREIPRQQGPSPPQTVAGDIEPPKPEAVSESGIGTSIATDE